MLGHSFVIIHSVVVVVLTGCAPRDHTLARSVRPVGARVCRRRVRRPTVDVILSIIIRRHCAQCTYGLRIVGQRSSFVGAANKGIIRLDVRALVRACRGRAIGVTAVIAPTRRSSDPNGSIPTRQRSRGFPGSGSGAPTPVTTTIGLCHLSFIPIATTSPHSG